MRRALRHCVAIAMAGMLAAFAAPAPSDAAQGPIAGPSGSPSGRVPGKLLVRLAPGITSRGSRDVAERLGARRGADLPLPGTRLLSLPAGANLRAAARRAERLPGVLYAEPDQYIDFRALPNDPLFERQWSLRNTGQRLLATSGLAGADINAPAAWDLSTGDPAVIVADVDTGVDLQHPDLAANIWTNPGEVAANHIDEDGNGYPDDVHGWDFTDADNDPDDSRSFAQGHGTGTASVIGAAGNNGLGMAGVAWRLAIIPLRTDTLSDTISAFIYARDAGARVINFSAGFPFYSQALKDTIENIGSVMVVNAADNGGLDGRGDNSDSVADFPCKFGSTNLVCVAASDQHDRLTRYSNFGPTSIDLAAPGENILTAFPPQAISFDLNEFFNGPLGGQLRDGGRRNHWSLSPKLGGSLTDSRKARYRNRTNSFVVSRPIDLRDRRACEVDLYLVRRLQRQFDRLIVQASQGGKRWRELARFGGANHGEFEFLGLPGSFSGARRARIRFRLHTNATVRRDGVYIDDVQVTCVTTEPTYAFFDGTSFSAPQVAGAAAVIWARHPSETVAEVKGRLLGSVDKLPSMAGMLVSGGRLDAGAALP